MSKEKNEKSCGAIIFDSKKQDAHVLVICQNDGHWCFPKGHVKANETEEETALREIKEETGYDVQLDTKFRKLNVYPVGKHEKENVYFIAYLSGGRERIQKEELKEIHWVNPVIALGCITFESDADILKSAMQYRKLKW